MFTYCFVAVFFLTLFAFGDSLGWRNGQNCRTAIVQWLKDVMLPRGPTPQWKRTVQRNGSYKVPALIIHQVLSQPRTWCPGVEPMFRRQRCRFCILFEELGARVERKSGDVQDPSCLRTTLKFPQAMVVWGTSLCFLLLTGFIEMLVSFFRRTGHLPTLPTNTSTWFKAHGIPVLDCQANWPLHHIAAVI